MQYQRLITRLKRNGHDPALFIQLSRNDQKRILRTLPRKPNNPNISYKKGRVYGPNVNHPYLGCGYKRQWNG